MNDNLPERVALYGGDTRKVSADEYWDDLAVTVAARSKGGENMLELGMKARDKITGFEGVVTAIAQYLGEETRFLVEARVKDGKTSERWFCSSRLEICEETSD